MKIQITGQGHNIRIPIPTGLIFNRLSVFLWLKCMRRQSADSLLERAEEKADSFFVNLPDEAVHQVASELMRARKKHGSWNLVEVESASGERVLISL